MEKVTAVVPSRNCKTLLRRCLLALAGSECVRQIIVVDDGSEDGTPEMVRSFWPGVTLLALSSHTGYAHAVNAGLRLVRTGYAFVIRPDLLPGKHCIEGLLHAAADPHAADAFLKKHRCAGRPGRGEPVFCVLPVFLPKSGNRKAVRETLAANCCPGTPHGTQIPRKKHTVRETLAVPDGCALYRMDVLEEIGWMDERHYEELGAFDLSLRAALYGYRTVCAADAAVRRDKGQESLFRLQLAAGNGIFAFYKNLPVPLLLSLFPLFLRVRISQRRAFRKKQEMEKAEEAFQKAIERGRMLCALERERRAALVGGVPLYPESLSEASFLGMEERASLVYPLYLAEKEPFLPARIPRYLRIQKLLRRDGDRLTALLSGAFFCGNCPDD